MEREILSLEEQRRILWEKHYKFAQPIYEEDNNVFVSSTGDDETGDGSMRAPFRTIGRALRGVTEEQMVDLWIEYEPPNTVQFVPEMAQHLHGIYLHQWFR